MFWTIRKALLLALAAGCGPAEEPAGAPLKLVLGAEAECAQKVRSVRVDIYSGNRQELDAEIAVSEARPLPQNVRVELLTTGRPHHVEAIFRVAVEGAPDQEIATAVELPDGLKGEVPLSLSCACIGAACKPDTYCAETSAGAGTTLCVSAPLCGDGQCDRGETSKWCPQDCDP